MKDKLYLLKFIASFLVLGSLVFSIGSCGKNNSQVVILSSRVITQLEYFRGTLNSTTNYSYQDNKIVYRDYEFDKSKYKYDYEYSGNQVTSFVSKKYDEYWGYTNSNVYTYESNLLQEVLYRKYDKKEWNVYERWTFTYNGNNYDAILMESVVGSSINPETKLKYSYSGDTLLGYKVYQFNEDWKLTKQLVFEYQDGVLNETTVFYALLGQDFRPQEQFIYQYTDGYNTKVVLSVNVDSVWVARNEILRNYNVNGKMVEEIVQPFGETEYNYRYVYAYELGEDNFEMFPFYEQPLYEFIYPTLSPSLQKALSMEAKNKSLY